MFQLREGKLQMVNLGAVDQSCDVGETKSIVQVLQLLLQRTDPLEAAQQVRSPHEGQSLKTERSEGTIRLWRPSWNPELIGSISSSRTEPRISLNPEVASSLSSTSDFFLQPPSGLEDLVHVGVDQHLLLPDRCPTVLLQRRQSLQQMLLDQDVGSLHRLSTTSDPCPTSATTLGGVRGDVGFKPGPLQFGQSLSGSLRMDRKSSCFACCLKQKYESLLYGSRR
ncbi:hypothetical protein INR49_021398 [Caranx melampygus]|nr:hypothetical protein INR49_021398 [Caranx melampygus]